MPGTELERESRSGTFVFLGGWTGIQPHEGAGLDGDSKLGLDILARNDLELDSAHGK